MFRAYQIDFKYVLLSTQIYLRLEPCTTIVQRASKSHGKKKSKAIKKPISHHSTAVVAIPVAGHRDDFIGEARRALQA